MIRRHEVEGRTVGTLFSGDRIRDVHESDSVHTYRGALSENFDFYMKRAEEFKKGYEIIGGTAVKLTRLQRVREIFHRVFTRKGAVIPMADYSTYENPRLKTVKIVSGEQAAKWREQQEIDKLAVLNGHSVPYDQDEQALNIQTDFDPVADNETVNKDFARQ